MPPSAGLSRSPPIQELSADSWTQSNVPEPFPAERNTRYDVIGCDDVDARSSQLQSEPDEASTSGAAPAPETSRLARVGTIL